ncbi:DnaB-like helicase N-terminal domain-containing protein [Microbulbifer sp. ZKSA004]
MSFLWWHHENTAPQLHSVYSDNFVLGGLLLDPDHIGAVAKLLNEEDF